jgi:hypothetical protein
MMRRRMEQLQTTMNGPGPSTSSQQVTSQPISLTSSYSTQPPPSCNTTSFSQRISPQFFDSNSSVQMNPSAISSVRQQAIMASPNAQQQSGMRMNGPGFHRQQCKRIFEHYCDYLSHEHSSARYGCS